METTASTSSDRNSKPGRAAESEDKSHGYWWPIAAALIVAVAALLRLHRLDLVPLHHDEGVNGYFLTHLYRDGFYKYDPRNYHGPALYYLSLPFVYALGLNTFAIRSVTAVFGVGIIWLVLELRKKIGRAGSLAAALLIALSPGAVYFSRYFIHETLFVFFTLAVAVTVLRYSESREPSMLFAAAVSVSLLISTKETSVITLGVFAIAAGLTLAFTRVAWKGGPIPSGPRENDDQNAAPSLPPSGEVTEPVVYSGGPSLSGSRRPNFLTWAVAIALAAAVFVCFYSSFFSNKHGVLDGLESLKFWAKTGESQHTHPWYSYLKWLWQMEPSLVVLAIAGALIAPFRKNRLAFFILLWSAGTLLAYSIIPYKTPWLTLNVIPPLALLAGTAVQAALSASRRLWPVVALVLVAAVFVSAYRSIKLNFFDYDDDHYAYVYAHTRREFLGIVREIESIASGSGQGKDITIAVVSKDYWPLPWYLRDYNNAGYYGQVIKTDAAIVVGEDSQIEELRASLGGAYRMVGTYTLRPGVDLTLYARTDVAPSK